MTEITQQRLDFVFVFLDLDEHYVNVEGSDHDECSQPAEQEEKWEASV